MRLSEITGATGVLAQMERQRRLMDSFREPAVLRALKRDEEPRNSIYRNLMEPTGIQAVVAHQERMQRHLRSPVLEQLARQQRLVDDLVRGPRILESLATVYPTIPSGLVEKVEEYGEDLVEEITYEAASAEEPVEVLDEGLFRIAVEREALVIALNRTSKMLGAAYLAGVSIPPLVVVMLLVFATLGEVADEVLQEREARTHEQN